MGSKIPRLCLCSSCFSKTLTLVSLVAQTLKNLPAIQEDLSWTPGLGRSPREGNGYPLQENPMDRGAWQGLQFKGSQRVGHDWATNIFHFHCVHLWNTSYPWMNLLGCGVIKKKNKQNIFRTYLNLWRETDNAFWTERERYI